MKTHIIIILVFIAHFSNAQGGLSIGSARNPSGGILDMNSGFTIGGTGTGFLKWDGSKYAPYANLLIGDIPNLASLYFAQGGSSFGTTAIIGTNTATELHFETNNVVRMQLTTSGFLGIGGPPSKMFDVNGEAEMERLFVLAGAANAQSITVGTTAGIFQPVGSGRLGFSCGNVERVRIDNQGDIVFNPTGVLADPTYDFEVKGTMQIDSDPTGNCNQLFGRTGPNLVKKVTIGTGLQLVTNVLSSTVVDTDDQTAAEVSFSPSGNFSSTDMQAATVEAYSDAIAYADANDDNTNIANNDLTADASHTTDWGVHSLTMDFSSHPLDSLAFRVLAPDGNRYGLYVNDVQGNTQLYIQGIYNPWSLDAAFPVKMLDHNQQNMVSLGNTADSLTIQADKLFLDVQNIGASASMEVMNVDTATDEVGTVDLTPLSGSGVPGVAPRWNGDRYFDYTNSKWYSAWDNEDGDGTGDGLDADDWIILN